MTINSKKIMVTLGIGMALANVLVGGCSSEEAQEPETAPADNTGTTNTAAGNTGTANTAGATPVPTLRDIQ